ncbi:Imm3 family immunity protein [Lysinibacillus sp. G4S2]|uniref:Imm3 family immunity protein n=1 Tax=Lysinibacillus sp. G4S2 TaxID=3055859 RepID=UPI0025A05D5A|nr:Imm3 family immunity protein [Lysinibacillus sp. G4S2]MDM5249106.1 Imm3 family immunity protein [Lysinibacillus sp. G4S2]
MFSYEEYKYYIYEVYGELVEEEKMSRKEAIARAFYEYDMLPKESETDKAMVFVIFSEIIITHLKVLFTFKNYIEQALTELDFTVIKQENKLTLEQFNELFSRQKRVLQELKKMPLDYYSSVCWYYDELIEEVQKFLNNLVLENKNVDSLVPAVLQRFDRDCRNTKSEKFIVYTTLAEYLLNQGLTGVKGFQDVKYELQSFCIKDVSDEQLSKDEQKKLAVRICNVLLKIKEYE